MKITLLSPVQVSGMHCFQWRDKICISKFYAIHMTIRLVRSGIDIKRV